MRLLATILIIFVTITKSFSSDSITVYLFLLDECRICQELAPEINAIHAEFAKKNIGFIGLFPNFASKQVGIDKFKKKYNITVSKFDDVLAYLGVNMTIYEMIQIPYWMNSPNQSKSFGYSNEELFLDINYFGLEIDPSELERFFDPYFGPCVRFNSGKNSRGESIPRLPLVVSGLGITMEIFMGLSDDIREYIFEPERRGLRVEVKGF